MGALASTLLGATCVPPAPPRQPESALPRPVPAKAERPVHVVRAGESACALAGHYGVAVPALLRANELASDDALAPGRRVRLPSEPLRHRLVQGETLWDVAHGYGVSVERLARENGIREPTRIPTGQWLRIPPGSRTGCPPATKSRIARAPAPDPGPPEPVSGSRSASAAEPVPASEPASVSEPAVEEEAEAPETRAERPRPDRASVLAASRRLLDRAHAYYDAAEFEAALELADTARLLLAPLRQSGEAARLESRAAWIAGLSHTGLGQRAPAVEAFRTALRLGPAPEPADAQALSPKIRALVESARHAPAAVSSLD